MDCFATEKNNNLRTALLLLILYKPFADSLHSWHTNCAQMTVNPYSNSEYVIKSGANFVSHSNPEFLSMRFLVEKMAPGPVCQSHFINDSCSH